LEMFVWFSQVCSLWKKVAYDLSVSSVSQRPAICIQYTVVEMILNENVV
jgi:hypothetical protein